MTQPKGAVVFKILVTAIFTVLAGAIVGAIIACAVGLICGSGGGGGGGGGTPTLAADQCLSAANRCGQQQVGTYDYSCPSGYTNQLPDGSGTGVFCYQYRPGVGDEPAKVYIVDSNGSYVTVPQTQTCNATTPSDSSCACTSSANACGQTNTGFLNSGGSCNANTPSNSSCPPPSIPNNPSGFSASPSTVGLNGTSTLTWNTTNSTSCSVSGDNGFSASGGASGSSVTGSLTVTTTFTLTCEDGPGGPTASRSIKVIVDPHYKEI